MHVNGVNEISFQIIHEDVLWARRGTFFSCALTAYTFTGDRETLLLRAASDTHNPPIALTPHSQAVGKTICQRAVYFNAAVSLVIL